MKSLPLHFLSFWAINGPLDRKRLFQQMEELQRLGLDGVVFHPRYYPGSPPYLGEAYLEILNETILHAKSLGMRFWIYDENGWPSGTADGRLFTQFPQDTCQRLELLKEPAGDVVTSFQHEGRRWHLCARDIRGIDCFNPEATRHFLEMIHEKYRTGLSAEAFDQVEAFFTDEPESGVSWDALPEHAAIPWSRHMPNFLREHFPGEVKDRLPLLFFAGEGAAEFRREYWELITDLFCRGFLDPYRQWCERQGKLFVGHVKGEEHPLFQIPMVGSCQRAYRYFGIPGIDSLERDPGNDFYPRQASSVARQFGDGRCLAEANGGAGWGNRPEDLERYLLWLAGHGLTDFAIHLSQYQLDSPALYDWPPSQPLHLSWRDAYPEIIRRVREKTARSPVAPRDFLVVAPYRRLMEEYEPWELLKTNIHDGDDYPLTAAGKINARFMATIEALHTAGVAYDITDERTLEEEGRVEPGGLCLGKARYATLLASTDLRLMKTGEALLGKARASGVSILSEAPPAREIGPRLASSLKPEVIDLPWSTLTPPENAFLLEPTARGDGAFKAVFSTPRLLPAEASLSVLFADSTSDVVLNGRKLAAHAGGDMSPLVVPLEILQPENELLFRSSVTSLHPFIWLAGDFAVRSRSAYVPGPNETVRTEGPLDLVPSGSLDGRTELVEAGLPFAFHPVRAVADIRLPSSARLVSLEFDSAPPDAVRFSLDGNSARWTWGPEWTIPVDPSEAGKAHLLEILCFPSSYNYYGPHHYYRGDTHVVSPDQIRGVRNFADAADASARTHVPAFHFKPWSLPGRLSVQT